MAIKKISLDNIKSSRGRTNKDELDKITDSQIAESVLSDKDSVIPTEKELKGFSTPKKREKNNEKND